MQNSEPLERRLSALAIAIVDNDRQRVSTFRQSAARIGVRDVAQYGSAKAALAAIRNCPRSTARSGSDSAICSARAMAPFMPAGPSVSTRFAPKALSTLRRSIDMVSGMVSVSL